MDTPLQDPRPRGRCPSDRGNLRRRFAPGQADVAWVGDIPYIGTGEGWLYLSSVLDLGSRRWLGYSMADHMRTELIVDALDMAVGIRGGQVKGTIFHGDRGSQYMSHDHRKQVVGYGMVQSLGRTGCAGTTAGRIRRGHR